MKRTLRANRISHPVIVQFYNELNKKNPSIQLDPRNNPKITDQLYYELVAKGEIIE